MKDLQQGLLQSLKDYPSDYVGILNSSFELLDNYLSDYQLIELFYFIETQYLNKELHYIAREARKIINNISERIENYQD